MHLSTRALPKSEKIGFQAGSTPVRRRQEEQEACADAAQSPCGPHPHSNHSKNSARSKAQTAASHQTAHALSTPACMKGHPHTRCGPSNRMLPAESQQQQAAHHTSSESESQTAPGGTTESKARLEHEHHAPHSLLLTCLDTHSRPLTNSCRRGHGPPTSCVCPDVLAVPCIKLHAHLC